MKRTLLLVTIILWSAELWAQNPFFQGKTITVISTSSTGSAYDIYARLVAQFMGRHIPGNPSFIVQNMAGAGSLIGTNYLYGLAKGDGTVIGGLQPSMYFNQLYKQPEAKYDWAKFNWLGSSDQVRKSTLYARRLAVQNYGGCAQGQGAAQMWFHRPRYFRHLYAQTNGRTARHEIHHHFRYKGGAEIDLAVERGELQCRALTIQAYHTREPYHTWRKTGFARILMQTGQTRDPRIADTPTIYELMNEHKTAESERRLLPLILAASDFGRPMVAPPGMPPARVKILREAFLKTLADSELLAEAKRKNLDITPTPGEELQELAKKVMVQTPEVVARVKTLME